MEPTDDRERNRRYVARLDAARATLADELEPEIEQVRALTLTERGQWVASACAAAAAIVEARRRAGTWHDVDEPPAADFAEKWQVLRARYRAQQRKSP